MNASTGVLIQALSAAAVKDGTAGLDRFTKAHCRRSVSVYFPRGATASAAHAAVNATDASASTGARYLVIQPSRAFGPSCIIPCGSGLAIEDNRFVRFCVAAFFLLGWALPLAAQDDLPDAKGKETLENTCAECH